MFTFESSLTRFVLEIVPVSGGLRKFISSGAVSGFRLA